MRGARLFLQATLLASGLLLGAGSAHAAPDPERKNTARGLADYANQLYAAGNYEGAIKAFRQADEIYHAPTLVFALARANAKAHHLLAARDEYRRVIDEQLAPDAPEEFRAAQRSAKEEIALVLTTIPTLEVHLKGAAAGPGIQLSIDDKPVTANEPRDVDPGKHIVKATGAGDPRTRAVLLNDRAHQIVEIDLDAAADSGPSLVPGGVIVGIGGLGLVVGVITGAITLHNAAAIHSTCSSTNVCPPSDMSQVSTSNAVAGVSTASFVIAGVGGVVGTILLVRAVQARPSVSASFGPGSLLLTGRF